MDVEMPIMDGLQATRLIRQKESAAHQHTRILAMTAYASNTTREARGHTLRPIFNMRVPTEKSGDG